MAKNSKSDRNPDSDLFRQLTRLLSGPIVGFRRQDYRKLRRRHLDKYKKFIKSSSGQSFKKSKHSTYSTIYQADFYQNQNRVERYVDFDQMEYTPEIASALDIYADEMTTSSNISPMMTINCPNQEIKSILETLYHSVLNIEFNLFGWCRTMCKYGDMFLYLDIDDDIGIKHAIGLPTNEVERLEGEDKTNPNYIQYQWNTAGLTLENWQIAHFRVLGNDKYAPYGTSVLEPARRIWRQLTLLEDAVMAYRIVRSPERRVFYIDVGGIAAEDIEQYMQKVMTQMKRNTIVDASSGRVDLRYNPLSIEEDYFIPVRGDVSSRVENLPGGTYTGDIDDIKYLRDKLFSALKVPPSYLTNSEGADEDKTTLAQKDIRFARTIQRLQRSVISELEKIGIIHLFTLGYRNNDLVSFKLTLGNPSKIAELQELEHWRTKFSVASEATEGYFSKRWVSDKLFGLSDEEFVRMQREMFYDKKHEASLEKAVEEITAPEEALGGDAGGGLGDLGGGDPLAAGDAPLEGDIEGVEGEEAAAGEEPADEEGGMLLAEPPAKRDENWAKLKRRDRALRPETTTKKSKGKWYKPETNDKRDMGARKRNYASSYAKEVGVNTGRNIFKGYSDLQSLSKGIYEDLNSNYILEEEKLLQLNRSVGQLIEGLEKRGDNET